MNYPLHRDTPIPVSPNLPALEAEVLAYWRADDTFKASIAARPAGENGANEFVFYDGPPFANGLPHYGHLLTGYAKDIVGRYQTQLGKRVERRFGWDTHGLPAELEAERILGLKDKSDIERVGIETFNEACRSSVLRYTKEWEEYVTRQARWVDFDNDYKTLDLNYMESVMWAFKQLYDKGLAYEGYRVLPYCWQDQTPLSNHELRMDDEVYVDRQDNTLTVGLRLETGELALIWTTTPWTLPSNLAVGVHPEVDYVTVVPQAGPLVGEKVLLAAALVGAYERELGEEPLEIARVQGAQLAGRRYAPIFDFFDQEQVGERAWTIITADFVTTADGTGLVHLAPAFGEDDMNACTAAGIGTVVPVDAGGCFTAQVPPYQGLHVFAANKPITVDLRDSSGPLAHRDPSQRAVLVRQASYVHSYPHCWRCKKPLIYKAVSSWFVRVSKFRDRMVELNQQINWVPEHIKDGIFGNWLAGARDWSISRNRYWGSPIPIWVSDDPAFPRIDVYGSLAQLEADFGRLPRNRTGEVDLHRPFIDELTRPNPDDPTGKATMRRIPDILDVWFDSGAMPFAQVHYPFENFDWFEHHYPGDFIVEYIGQTRGWFYTLHVLATALFDTPSFRNCISHGIVLGNDGRKASKSLRNYPDPNEMFDAYGSDAVRLALMSSPVLRGGNLVVSEESIREAVRQVLLPLWSTWYFFALYANAVGHGQGTAAKPLQPGQVDDLPVMDRYLLAHTRELVATVTRDMDEYNIPGACGAINTYLDLLTNWYVRTTRDRFWNEDEKAFSTLATVLDVLTRLMAPLAPLVSEEIWRGLTGGRSVHLTDWPHLVNEAGEPTELGKVLAADTKLVSTMDEVRAVVSAALSLRKANQVRVRQPLSRLQVIVADPQAIAPYVELLRTELNIKQVDLVALADAGSAQIVVSSKLTVNARAAGPRLGKDVQKVIAASRTGQWEQCADGTVVAAGITLREDEFEVSVHVVGDSGENNTAAAILPTGGFVALDLAITTELEAEGYARDLIRGVQDARKHAGLAVSDRIDLTVTVPDDKIAAVKTHTELISRETLALSLTVNVGSELEVKVVKR